jgi:hypothetical protein
MSAEIPLLLSANSIALTAPSKAADASAFISDNCVNQSERATNGQFLNAARSSKIIRKRYDSRKT